MLIVRKLNLCTIRNYHSENVFGFKRKVKSVYNVPERVWESRWKQCNFYRLVTAFRQHGHKCADINPVALNKHISWMPELDIKRYNLRESDQVTFTDLLNLEKNSGTVSEAVEFLRNVYTKTISAEFLYLENEEEIEWLSSRLEKLPGEKLDKTAKIRLVSELLKSQTLDNFLAKKFTTVKRYGGEGAESLIGFMQELFRLAADSHLEDVVLACPHRGRLNLLTGVLNFPPDKLFGKLKGLRDIPNKYQATGDVISHFVSSTDLQFDNDSVHVTMLYNPSHLEAVNAVSLGKTRGKQLLSEDGDYSKELTRKWSDKVLNVQIHGDAAFIGQGINQECLQLSEIPHFEVGGTVHLIVNNQVGFTTPSDMGRSSRYCSDLAKSVAVPVIHVNGDYPEMVLKAARIAFEFQRKFRKDVFVDLNCYRQWGHNELDDPTFTNPSLYSIIKNRSTVPDLYANKLVNEGTIEESQCNAIVDNHWTYLNEHLKAADNYQPEDIYFKKNWEGFEQPQEVLTTWDTGIDMDLMTYIGTKSVKYPENFVVHPTILRSHIKNRLAKVAEGQKLDWGTAEAISIGSLLFEGYNVRISGQDVGRGTFSNRHAMLVDQQTNGTYIPLNDIHKEQKGHLEIANSILSEEAVLGFEYGMSIENPMSLNIWEAQFGDFFNGAQIIFDTFITCGETKWLWSSGLVVLLPHGYDGAGPEHSSSRIERFLQLCDSKEDRVDGDNVNMQICQPSTPAQYFHLLRRQMVRNFRKPLIVITPKTLLRHSDCVSNFSDMVKGTNFQSVIGENVEERLRINRVLLTSGKHFYSLLEKRKVMGSRDTAIVRIESFCPFPTLELRREISKFPNAKQFVWCQEEPQNMGAWSFIRPRFENMLGKRLKFCGRKTSAAVAVGFAKVHQEEVAEILSRPFSYNELQ